MVKDIDVQLALVRKSGKGQVAAAEITNRGIDWDRDEKEDRALRGEDDGGRA